MTRNDPTTDNVKSKASVVSQMSIAIETHSGTDQSMARARWPGLRMTWRPSANVWATCASLPPILAGRRALSAPTHRPRRSGWPASRNSTATATPDTPAAMYPPSRTSGPISTPASGIATANSIKTVSRSRSRSTITVAKADVALSPSCRASRYGRNTSPIRAGNRKSAANPIIVVRNAVRKRVGPTGWSSTCHRSARIAYVCIVTTTAATMYPGWALRIARHITAGSMSFRKSHNSPAVSARMKTVDQRTRRRERKAVPFLL